ncbi:MAG TPA: sulfotransferase, partial [Solirubrobacterales bacterium]|nr:sulfotransferase [Solirubrobacterales bacterium]
MPDTDTHTLPPNATRDPADEAMCARARERYAADRKSRWRKRRKRHAQLPNLIIIGGLKCGTTSIHHYLGLHPEIQMSKPKELNFFARELNWDLGIDWYASRFDDRFEVRGESSPHYTNLPRFEGAAERIKQNCPDARLLYMVRDPIKRILSHWVHATGAGYEHGDLVEVLSRPDTSYVNRSKYWMQLQPYLERFDRSQIEIITQEELQSEREETMRKAFAFAGVDESFTSEQFDREWEKSSAKEGDKYQLMEKL